VAKAAAAKETARTAEEAALEERKAAKGPAAEMLDGTTAQPTRPVPPAPRAVTRAPKELLAAAAAAAAAAADVRQTRGRAAGPWGLLP
jgi:hypothetical protein